MMQFNFNLAESELKIILKALIKRKSRMLEICDTSGDEDEIAEEANDLVELRLLLKPLKDEDIKKYSKGIINFSRETL